jgi:hypothetical protein
MNRKTAFCALIIFFSLKPFIFGQNDGKGIVIAVPTPTMNNMTSNDNWMPQLFQDLITGNLVRYSAMTIIDRKNEFLTLAEQQISASGNYSDDNYIRMGRLTNAQYIVAGSILLISDNYQVSFRINNTETNETRTSFDKRYTYNDIESGNAANEISLELLQGMMINITDVARHNLTAPAPTLQVTATRQLAQGMVAEKSGNFVEAVSFYQLASSVDRNLTEATVREESVLEVYMPTSIRERAQWGLDQADKWTKIFSDLHNYMLRNLLIIVYDIGDRGYSDSNMDLNSRTVAIRMNGQGIKFVPNRAALMVFKKINSQWANINRTEENKLWTSNVRGAINYEGITNNNMRQIDFSFSAGIELLDEDNIKISNVRLSASNQRIEQFIPGNSDFPMLTQERYYENSNFVSFNFFSVKINNITDKLNIRIKDITWYNRVPTYSGYSSIMSFNIEPLYVFNISEWQEWLGGTK